MGLSNWGEKTWGRNDQLPSHKRTQLKFSRKLLLLFMGYLQTFPCYIIYQFMTYNCAFETIYKQLMLLKCPCFKSKLKGVL